MTLYASSTHQVLRLLEKKFGLKLLSYLAYKDSFEQYVSYLVSTSYIKSIDNLGYPWLSHRIASGFAETLVLGHPALLVRVPSPARGLRRAVVLPPAGRILLVPQHEHVHGRHQKSKFDGFLKKVRFPQRVKR